MLTLRGSWLIIVFFAGAIIGGFIFSCFKNPFEAVGVAGDLGAKPDVASLQIEIDRLKQLVPDQAHAMQDVDYHFTNLWFAANQSNWPLAHFYFNETRSHLRWAVRIIPVRKDNAGQPVKLQDILQAVENGPLKELEDAIKAKDRVKFATAYELTVTNCYACHKASDKPYLRPRIPDHPSSAMINFDPNATWPK